MPPLLITIVGSVVLLCVLGLAFDRPRGSRAQGVHRATRADHRFDQLEKRVDQHDERIDVTELIAIEAHVRHDLHGAPMLSPPPDGYPEQEQASTVVLPVRSGWVGVTTKAAGFAFTFAGVTGVAMLAVLIMLRTGPSAERDMVRPPPIPPMSGTVPPAPVQDERRPITATVTETVAYPPVTETAMVTEHELADPATAPAASSTSAAPRSEPTPPLSSSSPAPSEEPLNNPPTCSTPPVPPPPTECRGLPAARTVGEV